jgi:hypothetical protein
MKIFKNTQLSDIVEVITNKENENKDLISVALMEIKPFVSDSEFENLKSQFELSDNDLVKAESKQAEIYENVQIDAFLKEELDLKSSNDTKFITVKSIIKKILSGENFDRLWNTKILTEEEKNKVYNFIVEKQFEKFLKEDLNLK